MAVNWLKHVVRTFLIFDLSNRQLSTPNPSVDCNVGTARKLQRMVILASVRSFGHPRATRNFLELWPAPSRTKAKLLKRLFSRAGFRLALCPG